MTTTMSQIQTADLGLVKPIKNVLQDAGVFCKEPKIKRIDGVYCIYSSADASAARSLLGEYHGLDIRSLGPSLSTEGDGTVSGLPGLVCRALLQHVTVTPQMAASAPRKWSLYPPMVLFNAPSFEGPDWEQLESHVTALLFQEVLRFPEFRRCTHLAINKPITEADAMRRPFNIRPLYGDFGPLPTPELYAQPSELDFQQAFFCHVAQNGVLQTWAPMYTMFSRGNIKEKKRILDQCQNLGGTLAVDLYAGIGYFTFLYLRNGATVFAWEINPWSIEGLCRGLDLNGFKYRVFRREDEFSPELYAQLKLSGTQAFIFHESNDHAPSRLVPLGAVPIRHVNLGLLPSLQASWGTVQSVLAVSTVTCTVHVHENVHVGSFEEMKTTVAASFGGHVRHLERVKTFAPDVWHVVIDVDVTAGKPRPAPTPDATKHETIHEIEG